MVAKVVHRPAFVKTQYPHEREHFRLWSCWDNPCPIISPSSFHPFSKQVQPFSTHFQPIFQHCMKWPLFIVLTHFPAANVVIEASLLVGITGEVAVPALSDSHGDLGSPHFKNPPFIHMRTHIYIYICIHIYRIIEIYTLMLLSSRQYTGSTILNVSPCLWAGLKHHQLYGNSSTEARVTGWKTPRRNCSKVDAHENPWNFSWKTWCESHGGLQMVVLVSWKSWREENKSTNGCSFWCNELLLAGKLFT